MKHIQNKEEIEKHKCNHIINKTPCVWTKHSHQKGEIHRFY